jgi:hypothetical protein
MDKNENKENLIDISDLMTNSKISSDEDKACECDHCTGYEEGFNDGIDANWEWVQAALHKLKKASMIPKLYEIVENMTVKEFNCLRVKHGIHRNDSK